MALAILHPFVAPRLCACGNSIDPAGFHFLYCKHNHFSGLRDRVRAIAAHETFFHFPSFPLLVAQKGW